MQRCTKEEMQGIIMLWASYTTNVVSTYIWVILACSSFCKSKMDKRRANGMKQDAMYRTHQQLY